MSQPLPSAPEAEKAVLCSLLNNPDWTLDRCEAHGVTAESFYGEVPQIIFSAVQSLRGSKRPVDFITLGQFLRAAGKLEVVGGPAAVSDMFTFTTLANTGAYLDEIADKFSLRQTYIACMAAASEALNAEKPATEILDSLAGRVAQLSTGKSVADIEPIRGAVMDKMTRMTGNEPKKDVIRTGIDGLDRHSALNKGDMPCISGERKAGKSMLALTILAHIGLELKLPIGYVSLEDRTEAVIDRLTAAVSLVPCWKHHAKYLQGDDDTRLNNACTKLGLSRIYVKDDIFDLPTIVSFIKRLKAKEPALAAVVVDYAQLVRAKEGKGDTREQEVSRISRTLRLLAMELRIAVILLCQLNSEGDTRESKQIEMDTTAMWKVCNGQESGTKLLAIPFQRNGASNIAFPLTFRGDVCRFDNQAKTEVEDYNDRPQKSTNNKRNFHKDQ